jgi:hypothetical protein
MRLSHASLRTVLLLSLLLLASEGRPLFYWGARTAAIETGALAGDAAEAVVQEVHAARDGAALMLRFSFDRPVRKAMHLADGSPVSGRLRAVLYVDRDGERATGPAEGEKDLRAGCELRLELGVLALGADAEERRAAQAVVSATLYALGTGGRRRRVWQRDDDAHPAEVSAHGDCVELRVPWERIAPEPGARLVLAAGDRVWQGRLAALEP